VRRAFRKSNHVCKTHRCIQPTEKSKNSATIGKKKKNVTLETKEGAHRNVRRRKSAKTHGQVGTKERKKGIKTEHRWRTPVGARVEHSRKTITGNQWALEERGSLESLNSVEGESHPSLKAAKVGGAETRTGEAKTDFFREGKKVRTAGRGQLSRVVRTV